MSRFEIQSVLFVAALLGAGGLRTLVAEEEKTPFKAGLQNDDRYAIEEMTRLDMLLFHPDAKEDEGLSLVLVRHTLENHRVVEASGGLPKSLEVAFEEARETRTSPLQAGEIERSRWARGKTFDVARAGEQVLVRVRPPADTEAEIPEDLRARLAAEVKGSMLDLLPNDPVTVGHEWTRSGEGLIRILGDLPGASLKDAKASFRFKAVEKDGGKSCAVVEIKSLAASLERGKGSANLRLIGRGELRIALDSGLALSLKLEGKADLEGDPGGVKGVGTFSVQRSTRPAVK